MNDANTVCPKPPTCPDCGSVLPFPVQYVRRHQPDQAWDPLTLNRDKLCQPCWDKDSKRYD